jgi:hypothetical protein
VSGPYGRRGYVEGLAGKDDVVTDLWGGHVLIRPIPGGGVDAASAYPMGGFAPVRDLDAGLDGLRAAGVVSLKVVADPLNGPDPAALAVRADRHRRLKTHYVIDRAAAPYAPSKHHRYEIRRAQRHVVVDRVGLAEIMDSWRALYGHLSGRHGIDPAAQLGRAHFDALSRDPQAIVMAATLGGETVAVSIWLSDGEVAHNHLGASSEAGYRVGASYALYAAAIEVLAPCRVIDLGGMPGLADDPAHGLARFKRGFANAERATWLSGFILDRPAYDAAVCRTGADPDGCFFPAYRAR